MTEAVKYPIDRFLAYVATAVNMDDRGTLADLRHGFSPGTEYRTWRHIAEFCALDDDHKRKIFITIAAGSAMYASKRDRGYSLQTGGNMGVTMRRLALKDKTGSVDEALATFEARFRRILSADTAEEVCDHLVSVIRAAENKNVPIDFKKLFWDLTVWHKPERNIKVQWAKSFWSGENESANGGEAS